MLPFCLWFFVLRDTSATRFQHDWKSNQLINGSLCLPEKSAHYAFCSPQGHGVYAIYNPNTQIIKPERLSWKRNPPNSPANTTPSVALLHKQGKIQSTTMQAALRMCLLCPPPPPVTTVPHHFFPLFFLKALKVLSSAFCKLRSLSHPLSKHSSLTHGEHKDFMLLGREKMPSTFYSDGNIEYEAVFWYVYSPRFYKFCIIILLAIFH